jgi:hypothetical protein
MAASPSTSKGCLAVELQVRALPEPKFPTNGYDNFDIIDALEGHPPAPYSVSMSYFVILE